MRGLLVLAGLLALCSAQGGWNDFADWFDNNREDDTIDFVHNYRFEDHGEQNGVHLLVAISDIRGDRSCHLIEINNIYEAYVSDPHTLHMMTEEIFHLIENHTAQESTLTRDELQAIYGDSETLQECYGHTLYILYYIPSFTTPAPPA